MRYHLRYPRARYLPLCMPCGCRTLHTETGGPKPAETRLGHVHGVPESDGPAPDTRGRSRETGSRARAAIPRTSGSRRPWCGSGCRRGSVACSSSSATSQLIASSVCAASLARARQESPVSSVGGSSPRSSRAAAMLATAAWQAASFADSSGRSGYLHGHEKSLLGF